MLRSMVNFRSRRRSGNSFGTIVHRIVKPPIGRTVRSRRQFRSILISQANVRGATIIRKTLNVVTDGWKRRRTIIYAPTVSAKSVGKVCRSLRSRRKRLSRGGVGDRRRFRRYARFSGEAAARSSAWRWIRLARSNAWRWVSLARTRAWRWIRLARSSAWRWIRLARSNAWRWPGRAPGVGFAWPGRAPGVGSA